MAGTALAYRKGHYILNDIAVREDLRGQGLGRIMLEKSLDKLRRLGAETCYLTAKTPKFFEKYGFDYLDSKEAPDIFSCLSCSRFKRDCFPEFMKLDFQRK